MLPGEAVLLNGSQSTYATSSSSTNTYKPAAAPLPPPPSVTLTTTTTTTRQDDSAAALYAHGGGGGHSRLSWHETVQPGVAADCPTCGVLQPAADMQSTCNLDDSQVCFTEKLMRRKLLLGRCAAAADSQYDRVPMSGAASDVVMRTFKGLSAAAQSCDPCPPGPAACWTSSQPAADHADTH